MRLVTTLALSLALASITVADHHGKVVDLLAGDALDAWVDERGKPLASDKWVVKDGVLHLTGKGGGNIYTARPYGNFELRFEWKIAEKGNSGVKYRMKDYDGKGRLGPEYQVYDDQGKPFAKGATASLYDIVAPDREAKAMKPPGEWNSSRIVANGKHLQHFLNGRKVVDITIGTAAWRDAVAQSKFRDVPAFAENPQGPIMLQDHGSEAWYRKLTIRELSPQSR